MSVVSRPRRSVLRIALGIVLACEVCAEPKLRKLSLTIEAGNAPATLEADRDSHEQGQRKRVVVPHPLPELHCSGPTGADTTHENDGVRGSVALALHARLAGHSGP